MFPGWMHRDAYQRRAPRIGNKFGIACSLDALEHAVASLATTNKQWRFIKRVSS